MVQPNMKKAGGLFVVSHWIRGAWDLHFTQQGFDAQFIRCSITRLHRRAVHPGRISLRAESFARNCFVWRSGDARAKLSIVFMITMLASIGLPMLNNFIGEFLVLQGAALINIKWSVFRRDRRDPVGVLHAVALSTSLLRTGFR